MDFDDFLYNCKSFDLLKKIFFILINVAFIIVLLSDIIILGKSFIMLVQTVFLNKIPDIDLLFCFFIGFVGLFVMSVLRLLISDLFCEI